MAAKDPQPAGRAERSEARHGYVREGCVEHGFIGVKPNEFATYRWASPMKPGQPDLQNCCMSGCLKARPWMAEVVYAYQRGHTLQQD